MVDLAAIARGDQGMSVGTSLEQAGVSVGRTSTPITKSTVTKKRRRRSSSSSSKSSSSPIQQQSIKEVVEMPKVTAKSFSEQIQSRDITSSQRTLQDIARQSSIAGMSIKKDSLRERISSGAGRAIATPERLIQEGLTKIRESPGTGIVLSRSVTGSPKVRTEFGRGIESDIGINRLGGASRDIQTGFSVGDVLDVASFFVPGVGQVRAGIFAAGTAGEVIQDPGFIREKPLQVAAAAAIGLGGIVRSASVARGRSLGGEISKLESRPVEFFQAEEGGIVRFFGKQTTPLSERVISLQGAIKETELGRKFIPFGEGSVISKINAPEVLGLRGTSIADIQQFKFGTKGGAAALGEFQGLPVALSAGISSIEPIAGRTGVIRGAGSRGARITGTTGGDVTKQFSTGLSFGIKENVNLLVGPEASGISVRSSAKDLGIQSFKPEGAFGGGSFQNAVTKTESALPDLTSIAKTIKTPKPIISPRSSGSDLAGLTSIKPQSFITTNIATVKTDVKQSVVEPMFIASPRTRDIPIESIVGAIGGVSSASKSRGRSGSISRQDPLVGQLSVPNISQIPGAVTSQIPTRITGQKSRPFDIAGFSPGNIIAGTGGIGGILPPRLPSLKEGRAIGTGFGTQKRVKIRPSFTGIAEFELGGITGDLGSGGIGLRFVPSEFAQPKKKKKKCGDDPLDFCLF